MAAHVAFALYTLAISGELPDWGQYLAFLHAFLFGDLGDLTYDFSPGRPDSRSGPRYLAAAALLLPSCAAPHLRPAQKVPCSRSPA